MAKNRCYVVWIGRSPGVYDKWADCEKQVKGFPGCKFKGFPTRVDAEQAYQKPYTNYLVPDKTTLRTPPGLPRVKPGGRRPLPKHQFPKRLPKGENI